MIIAKHLSRGLQYYQMAIRLQAHRTLFRQRGGNNHVVQAECHQYIAILSIGTSRPQSELSCNEPCLDCISLSAWFQFLHSEALKSGCRASL